MVKIASGENSVKKFPNTFSLNSLFINGRHDGCNKAGNFQNSKGAIRRQSRTLNELFDKGIGRILHAIEMIVVDKKQTPCKSNLATGAIENTENAKRFFFCFSLFLCDPVAKNLLSDFCKKSDNC